MMANGDARRSFEWSVGNRILAIGQWLKDEYAARREAIGGIDNLWLLLGDATDFNPVCASTYVLEDPLTYEDLVEVVLNMANEFPRYKQRLTSLNRRWHGARFEDDPDFSIQNHVHVVSLPEPAGKDELEELVEFIELLRRIRLKSLQMGEFIAKDWDLCRPLWETLLVENYRGDERGKGAILTRGHHTLADGQGFVLSQLYLTSYFGKISERLNNSAKQLHAAKSGNLRPSEMSSSLKPLDRFVDDKFTAPLIKAFMLALFWCLFLMATIVSFFWSTYHVAYQIYFFLLTFWRSEKLTAHYSGRRVKEREFCRSKAFRMQDIKLCQKAFSGAPPHSLLRKVQHYTSSKGSRVAHVTLNDVICSVMADVVGEELQEKRKRGLGPQGWKKYLNSILPSHMGFFIPISLREPGDWSMRNLSTGSMAYLKPSDELTHNITNSRLYSHIHQCRKELALLKHSLWPRIVFNITQLTGQAPVIYPLPFFLTPKKLFGFVPNLVREWITIPFINLALESIPAIITNVPGPSESITIAQAKVLQWGALPPQAGKGTVGVGILSYNGGVCISVSADSVPGSKGVTRRLCRKFEERLSLYIARAKMIQEEMDG